MGHERVSLVRCSREITGQRTRRALGTTAVAEYYTTRGRLAALAIEQCSIEGKRSVWALIGGLVGGLSGRFDRL
jgi:hypothetical protein